MEKLQKQRLWLLAGIPGSGKSTWIQNHKNFFAPNHAVISRDKIRFSLLEEGDDYFSKEKEVWNQYVAEIKESLKFNTDTILDATHLNEASRSKILRALKNYIKNIEINIIVINSGLKTAIERNKMREGRSFVPLSAIRRMNSVMTMPTLNEGFDKIYIYTIENGKPKYQILEKGTD